jgi:predicted phosphodiesterase
MKIAILGDTHFGVRGDSIKFHDYYRKFYENEFFPYLEKNNISYIFQLGDLFDRRKYINFNTLALAKDYFFNPIASRGLHFYTLLGNHDIFWKESLEVNSTGLVLGEYNINLIDEPTKIEIENTSIDMIPWICKENQKEVFEYIDQSKSDLCFGHFEIAGFPMYKGMVGHHGLSHEMFSKYERVLSGHYHTRSKQENIEYVGTPYEMTWQDYNDPRGFSVFDTETRELEFIRNPYTIHEKITYDDKNHDPIDLSTIDIKDKYVKLAVVNKTDLYKFDQFVNEMYTKDAYEIKIIEDFSEFNDGEISTDINIEDTMSILSNYVDSVETEENKEEIKSVLKELYLEAINQEVV